MKKTLILAIVAVTIFTLGGCTIKKSANSQSNSKQEVSESVKKTYYVGKVEKAVGNELTLRIAKSDNLDFTILDGAEENNQNESQSGDSDFSTSFDDGGVGNALTSVPMESGDDIDMTGDNVVSSELEYTDEIKDISILGGVEIFSTIVNRKASIADIKEGSVLRITINSADDSILKVEILE